MQKSKITSKLSLIAVIAMVLLGAAGHWLFYANKTPDGFNLICSICDLFELLIMAILFHLNKSCGNAGR